MYIIHLYLEGKCALLTVATHYTCLMSLSLNPNAFHLIFRLTIWTADTIHMKTINLSNKVSSKAVKQNIEQNVQFVFILLEDPQTYFKDRSKITSNTSINPSVFNFWCSDSTYSILHESHAEWEKCFIFSFFEPSIFSWLIPPNFLKCQSESAVHDMWNKTFGHTT